MQKTYLLNRMGIAMWRQKRLREAKDCFLQALDTAREEKETIHYNLAQCLIDLDDRSSARHHLEKALEHKEDFPEARVLLSKLGPA
jgi:Tfp pilus assembly protein PilF